MPFNPLDRRDFIKAVLAAFPVLSLDWDSFPRGRAGEDGTPGAPAGPYDAIVIGAGLGGLGCGAAFARQGFKVLVLEKHNKPGGYATTFKRSGGFVFDASLHSTTVGERDGVHNLIPGFPEIKDVTFVPHTDVWRAVYPDDDIRFPARNIPGVIRLLADRFPDEQAGIQGLFDDMQGMSDDIGKLSAAGGRVNPATFAKDYPTLARCFGKTWGGMVDARVKNPKLKGLVSSLWGYYGLPPSKLSAFYYALPTIGYLSSGGYYPIGKSQKLSDTFVKFITDKGGTVKLSTRVDKVLIKAGAAEGVRTEDGKEYRSRVVVANADPLNVFHKMIAPADQPQDYVARLDKLPVSISSFQIFLGLKKDLVKELGIKDSEIFYGTGYDVEAEYEAAMKGEVGDGYGLTLYDNLYKGYSPEGRNTVSILTLQGYAPWEKYEADYAANRKTAYRKEKERMADIMIDLVEKTLMPGLRSAIRVRDVATPLTNVRYTANYRGAIYGWDQTLATSGPQRLAQKTPIKNLYLAGAWTFPGGGIGAVLSSGLACFGEIMKTW